MDAAGIMMIVSGALNTLQVALPELQKRAQAGEISAEDQQKVLDDLNALRDPGNYTGPEFEPSGR